MQNNTGKMHYNFDALLPSEQKMDYISRAAKDFEQFSAQPKFQRIDWKLNALNLYQSEQAMFHFSASVLPGQRVRIYGNGLSDLNTIAKTLHINSHENSDSAYSLEIITRSHEREEDFIAEIFNHINQKRLDELNSISNQKPQTYLESNPKIFQKNLIQGFESTNKFEFWKQLVGISIFLLNEEAWLEGKILTVEKYREPIGNILIEKYRLVFLNILEDKMQIIPEDIIKDFKFKDPTISQNLNLFYERKYQFQQNNQVSNDIDIFNQLHHYLNDHPDGLDGSIMTAIYEFFRSYEVEFSIPIRDLNFNLFDLEENYYKAKFIEIKFHEKGNIDLEFVKSWSSWNIEYQCLINHENNGIINCYCLINNPCATNLEPERISVNYGNFKVFNLNDFNKLPSADFSARNVSAEEILARNRHQSRTRDMQSGNPYSFRLTGVPPNQARKVINVLPTRTIAEIKEYVGEIYGISSRLAIQFILKGKVLPDATTFEELKINPRIDEITVMLTQAGGRRKNETPNIDTNTKEFAKKLEHHQIVSFEIEGRRLFSHHSNIKLPLFSIPIENVLHLVYYPLFENNAYYCLVLTNLERYPFYEGVISCYREGKFFGQGMIPYILQGNEEIIPICPASLIQMYFERYLVSKDPHALEVILTSENTEFGSDFNANLEMLALESTNENVVRHLIKIVNLNQEKDIINNTFEIAYEKIEGYHFEEIVVDGVEYEYSKCPITHEGSKYIWFAVELTQQTQLIEFKRQFSTKNREFLHQNLLDNPLMEDLIKKLPDTQRTQIEEILNLLKKRYKGKRPEKIQAMENMIREQIMDLVGKLNAKKVENAEHKMIS